jgi:transposase
MRRIPHLSPAERKQLVRAARRIGDRVLVFRCTILAALAVGGRSQRQVASLLSCAPSTVSDTKQRFLRGGFDGLRDRRVDNGVSKVDDDYREGLRTVLFTRPTDHGWQRPTWTRELVALEMQRRGFALVSVAVVGRALHDIGARRGNPKPIVLCPWPRRKRQRVLNELLRLCGASTDEEPVFHADEVDIHLNPKIGLDWMNRGHQKWVVTPGQNTKHYLAGARHVETGRLTWVEADKKTSTLFCDLLDRLVEDYGGAVRIHVICDNYIIHSSRITARHVDDLDGKIVLHFLPPYCPDHNRIERVWQDLHANVTRNHRCRTMDELLANVRSFLHAYNDRERLNPSLRRAIAVAA